VKKKGETENANALKKPPKQLHATQMNFGSPEGQKKKARGGLNEAIHFKKSKLRRNGEKTPPERKTQKPTKQCIPSPKKPNKKKKV